MEPHFPSKRSRLCHALARSRLLQLILCLLLVLIVTPLVAHYYLSNIGGEAVHEYRPRSPLEHSDMLDSYGSDGIKDQIEELRRIKASVNNELRDLESRQQGLQLEIASYKTNVETFRLQQETLEKEIAQSRLSLDQLKLEQSELASRFMPLLKAPEDINLKVSHDTHREPPGSPRHCQMYNCFDYTKCSLWSGFPVFVYKLDLVLPSEAENSFLNTVVSSVTGSGYLTDTGEGACVYIVLLGEASVQLSGDKLMVKLRQLQYWNGDGINHVLLNVARTPNNVDIFQAIGTDRAIIVQSSFIDTFYRDKFDIVIPPSLGKYSGPVWSELLPLSPVRRKYFLSFFGQFSDRFQAGTGTRNNAPANEIAGQPKLENFNSDQNFRSRNIKSPIPSSDSSALVEGEISIVANLKAIQTDSKESVHLQFVCDNSGGMGVNGEWALCQSENVRAEILKQSTFSIIISPANTSVVSTTVFQIRIYESLKCGAVPVILGDYSRLPFSELLDWHKAALVLPKSRVSELHYYLRTFTDNDVMELKRHGRLIWEAYFGTTDSLITTTLAVIRTRLQIPARPVNNEPSPNAIENIPLSYPSIIQDPEDETDEILGPIEPPFPSIAYKQNFTVGSLTEPFQHPGDPFHLYPFTPFEKVLPAEAKFIGSRYGFRPINKGEGGSGKEFSEALGGNHPREQFTMVMLTYEREQVLIQAVARLKGLPYLNKVIVVWNNPAPPTKEMGWPDIGVPVHVVKMSKNSLNNRFLPFKSIETEAVLSIDDDVHLRHDEIVFGFRVWREERDRVVGFPGRYHAWDVDHNAWLYNSNYSCEMSMVLTGAAFFHKYYAYLYSQVMPQAIRDKVDEYVNCEDIAMNFLVSHITRKPPVKVTSRWTFRCPGCAETLATDITHFEERHKCINFFVQVYGYMPLLYTQYRVDSILFKTRISHNKQKCFKFI